VIDPPPFSSESLAALEQARVQEKDVAGIGLAARRTPQQERDLAVRLGVLGKIVVDDQHVFVLIHQLFGHRAARIRRDVLERRSLRRADGDDRRVLHRVVLRERLGQRRNGRRLLPDRDVDAIDAFAALVDDRVDRDRRLTGRAIADDEFALAAPDRNQRVDRADAGL